MTTRHGRLTKGQTRFYTFPYLDLVNTHRAASMAWKHLRLLLFCFDKDCTTPTAPKSATAELSDAPPTSTMQLEASRVTSHLPLKSHQLTFKTFPYPRVPVSLPRVSTCKLRSHRLPSRSRFQRSSLFTSQKDSTDWIQHGANGKSLSRTVSDLWKHPLPRLSRLSRFSLPTLSWFAHFALTIGIPTTASTLPDWILPVSVL